jgi:hypothetical protein
MTVDSFTSSGVSPSGAVGSVGTQAESVVTAFGRLRVTHDFHPTPLTPNLYEVDVTIENISTTDVTDLRYTRTMDWDIYPTYFDEYVTIQGVGSAANLLYADDNGFQDPNPLLTRSASNVGNMVDNGPDDHGAHFDFGFGPLPAGGTQTFRIYYGAAPTEAGANAALTAVGAEAYSFGQSNGGQVTGSPVTFIFAFSGVGGSVLIPPDLLLEPTADTNNVGETHTLTATLTDDSGNPVSGVTVTFEVVGGPNTGTLGTAVTNSSGVATISYSSTVTGTDAIVASFVDGDSNTQNSNGVTKEWVTPPNVAPTVSTPNSSVTVDEGDTANNNGSFSDPDAGDSVTISASVGTVTQSGSQSGTWSWSFNSTDGPAESQTVTITATDGSSAIGTTTFGLTVNNVAPNIDKGVVDLNTWTAENISSGSGVWTVDGSGNSVFQSVNGNPTFFYSDFSSLGSPLQGTIRVETTSDDDFIGFAIGFNPGDTANPSADYLLVDWKQYNQPDAWGYGAQGLAVSRVNGVGSNPDFWSHSGALTELARGITLGNTGWGDYQINEFQFDFTPTRLRVFVNGTLELDVTPTGPNFSDGRFAFFNFSQSSVRYSAIQSDSIAGVEASPVSFSKNFTDPGIPDTHTATINWGDSGTGGETVTSPSGSTPGTVSGTHTYADNGTYTVTVTVCDSDLDCDSDTFTATIANVDPTVDANGPYSVNEGSSVTLNATGFDVAGAADPLTYAWDLDNNGSFETPGQSAPFNGIDGPSTHTVNVQVNDGDGGTAVDSATVTVNNLDPVVTATGDTINEGDTATVSGTISDPGTPDSFTVVIDWGGSEGSDTLSLPAGSTSYSATHVYDDDDPTATLSDNYGISVTVTDDDGGIGSASATVTVNNVDPVIESGVVDLNSWTVENSSPGAGVWTVDGSGNSVFQSVNGNPTFFYSDFNALGSPLEGAIAVETGSDDDYIGFAIGFEPGDTSNPSADFLLVDWKQGDQSGALAGLAVSRVTGVPTGSDYWTHSGAITELARGITLGSTGWANYASNQFLFEFSPTRLRVFVNGTLELDVTPTGPNFSDGRFAFYNYSQYYVRYSAIQSDSISGNEASPVSFTKNFTDVGIPDTHTATILWGDTSSSAGTITEPSGSTPGTVSGTHTYADNGTYTVTVTVCDDDGGCDSDTFTATIANVDPTVDANGPYSVNEGSSVTLNATGFDVAGPADPLTYAWDLDNNGSFETPGQSVPFNGIDGPSTHTVNVQVNDGDGGIAVDTTTVTVNNVDPTIVTTFQVAPIPEASVSTSGNLVAQATDPAGSNDPLAFDFDCDNNGSYETPSNPSTSAADCYFDDNGSYTVGVRVTDGDGGQAIGSVIAVVTVGIQRLWDRKLMEIRC